MQLAAFYDPEVILMSSRMSANITLSEISSPIEESEYNTQRRYKVKINSHMIVTISAKCMPMKCGVI